jgi:hypothetical protein
MDRHHHRSNNAVLGAPPGVPIEECGALPITRIRYSDGTDAVASYWMPNDAERALITAGAAVRVIALGVTQPPMILGADGDGVL